LTVAIIADANVGRIYWAAKYFDPFLFGFGIRPAFLKYTVAVFARVGFALRLIGLFAVAHVIGFLSARANTTFGLRQLASTN